MLTEIASAVASLNHAKELIKSALGVVKDTAARDAIIELQGTILSLHNSLFQAHLEQQALIDVKKELEQKLIDCENWNADAANYELLEVSFGVRVYSEKSQQQRIYDRVWLCPNCFESKQKRTLQLQRRRGTPWEYVCNHCKALFKVRPENDT